MRRGIRGRVAVAAMLVAAAPATASASSSICDPLSASSLMAGGRGLGERDRRARRRGARAGARSGPQRHAGVGEERRAEELQGDDSRCTCT